MKARTIRGAVSAFCLTIILCLTGPGVRALVQERSAPEKPQHTQEKPKLETPKADKAQDPHSHTHGQQKNIDPDKLKEAGKEASEAAEVFGEIMRTPEKAIPRELLERAEAVAVFPKVIKAAFIVGGRGGDGVISRRTGKGWSAPAFFKLGGASFGAQIGAESTDYVMLFMNEGALKGLLEDKFEIGGEASIAAGPVGRTASASTNVTLDAGILSYSRSKGAFIGAALKGGVINPDNDLNRAIYGMAARELLATGKGVDISTAPEVVRIFPQTLAQYTTSVDGGGDAKARARQVSFAAPREQPDAAAGRSQQQREATLSPRAINTISREVRHELMMLPYYSVFDWIEYEVRPDGTVVLSGFVRTPPDTKSRAEARVKTVEGVERVINNIETLPVSPNDDRLRQRLHQAIYTGPLFRYGVGVLNTIHIVVRNGRATLYGLVDSESDKQLAYMKARSVPGLFEVNNRLVVRNKDDL